MMKNIIPLLRTNNYIFIKKGIYEMKRIRTLVLSFLFACAVLFVPFAVNAGYGIQNVAAAEEDESTTDYSTKYVVLSLEGFTIGQGFYITPTRMSYEEIGNVWKQEGIDIDLSKLTVSQATYAFFKKAGLQTEPAGSSAYNDSNFYLSNIKGIDKGTVKVPTALLDAYKTRNNGNDLELDDKTGSGLGEFDYTSWSGWMITDDNVPCVPFINYATTLLAAADASVGGKTAVDTPLATNLIGLFNQPRKVYIDIAAWKTLPKRQMASGMAETIKHACLASREMFEFIEENLDDIMSFQKFACEYIAENNCKIKYDVVMKDERESGLREVLNLGHTVGRAIETVSDYRLLHGEALSIGMAAMVLLSARLGYMSEEEAERVTKLYARVGLPTRIPDYIDREALVKKLYTDKKVRDGKLRFVIEKALAM